MKGRILLAGAVLIATVTQAQIAGAVTALYLVGNSSLPSGSLSESPPGGGALPNYDPDRDSAPGLLLQKSSDGVSESDPVKYQQWEFNASGTTVSTTDFSIWVAVKDFAPDKTVRFAAYLFDCDSSCTVLTSATKSVSNTSSWVKATLPMDANHTFGSGRSLVIKVVVLDNSDDDGWLAYGTSTYDAHLALTQSTTTTTSTSTTLATTTSTTVQVGSTTTSISGSPTTTSPGSGVVATSTTSTPKGSSGLGDLPPSDTDQISPAEPTSTDETSGPDLATAGFVDTNAGQDLEWIGTNLFDGRAGRSIGPEEGLMVVFATVAEVIEIYWQAALALGVVTAILLWAGVNRELETS